MPTQNQKKKELAIKILEENIITPEEISDLSLGFIYTKKQISDFYEDIPPINMLLKCRDNRCIVVAGPPNLMSCGDMFKKNFSIETNGFEKETFFYGNKAGPKWIVLQPPFYMDSCLVGHPEHERLTRWKKFIKEIKIGGSSLAVACNLAEIAWCLLIFQRVRGKKFFVEEYDGIGVVETRCNPKSSRDRGWGINVNYLKNGDGISIMANGGAIV